MTIELRWRQRYENFQKALIVFERRVNEYLSHSADEAYQMSLVQAFEVILELSWKTLKDYLEYQGYGELNNSRKVIRLSFQNDLIIDASTWMTSVEMRNETSHVYNSVVMKSVLQFIVNEFYPILRQLNQRLKIL